MKVAVKDACILIDLVNGGLLQDWFQLRLETYTTDLVMRQLQDSRQWSAVNAFVKSKQLLVLPLTSEELVQCQMEFGHLPIGLQDRSVLYLADKLGAILLTGDRRVRLEGTARRLEVHGVLWVLDRMLSGNILSPKRAAKSLRAMLGAGAFLPTGDCKTRLAIWDADEQEESE